MINTTALFRAICKKYSAPEEFSAQMGWAPNKAARLLAGDYLPDVDECAALADCLDLTQSEFCEIFLPGISQNRENKGPANKKGGAKKSKNNFSGRRAVPSPSQGQTRFEGCLSIAKEMAEEVLVHVTSQRRGNLGIIEMSGPIILVDEGCTFKTREALTILMSNASSTMIQSKGDMCCLRFAFRLYGEPWDDA